MAEIKRIGLITSGGDCGGLNAVIKAAAAMADGLNIACFIIPNGYAGLYNLLDFDKLTQLSPERLDLINATLAGSEAGHSRVKIGKIPDTHKYDRIKQGLKKFSLDALIISGGDDTGSVVLDLYEHGIACVHVPKTMDLDLQTYSVGADSAINRIADFVNDLKTTAATHNRIIALEVFGRYAGHTALRGGIAGDADAILIPEIPVDFDLLYAHMKKNYMRRILASDVTAGSYIIVVAEGMKDVSGKEITDESMGLDAFGHKKLAGAGKYVCNELTKRLKDDAAIKKFMQQVHMFVQELYVIPEARAINPSHLVRCGVSSAYDINFGKEAGSAAVLLLKKGITGVTVSQVAGQEIRYMKIEEAIKPRSVDLSQVALFESLGICFGRKTIAGYAPQFKEIKGLPERYL